MGDVLLRKGALGDVVLLGSVTAAAAGPVTVVTDRRWLSLVARLKGVDRAVPWPVSAEGLPPGRVIDLQRSVQTLRWPAARRLRKHSLRRRLHPRFGGVAARPTVPEIYARAVGVEPAPPPWLGLPRVARDTLVLAPGAAWAPKRWSVSGFAEVGREWSGPVAVLGGPGEGLLVNEVVARIPGAIGVAEHGFGQTLEVLARARVAVAGDTGLMHLAGAAGVPVVALFGPTHPADGFWVYPGEVVQRERWCRPCTLHRISSCPLGHGRCMRIAPERVVEAVLRCAG
ncbi:MAG: hypothetical protein ACI8PZ_001481 [Myxococcota bacterium]